MAWSDDMPTILRATIQDTATPQVYTDPQLVTIILVSTISLQTEVAFVRPYVASISLGTLTPDPTDPALVDNVFVNLCCTKAALLLVAGEIKAYSRQAIRIRDGGSELELRRDPRILDLMYRAYKDQYDEALYAYKTGGDEGLGEIITSPYPYLGWNTWGINGMFEGYPGPRGYRSEGGGGCGGPY